jgi:diguanylate cyclase (GGDEF)-like protein/PAS domain S-box-containing protein/putative nucleotidyltransferase with HDIG domain
MPPFDRKKKRFFSFKNLLNLVLYACLLLSFFIVPYVSVEGRRLVWCFVWQLTPGQFLTSPIPLHGIALQYIFFFFALIYFIYLQRLERFLNRQMEELPSAITNLDVGFFRERSSTEGGLIHVNEGFIKMLGYNHEELLSLKSDAFYFDVGEAKRFKGDLVQRGSMIRELRLKKKDGAPVWAILSARTVKSDSGGAEFFEYVVMDIRERKWMEEEMAQAYQRFESVIQNTPNIAIQGYSLEGKVLEWNHASEALYGYGKHESVGKGIRELFRNETDWREFEEAFAYILQTARPAAPREWHVKNKLGHELTVYSSIFPIMQQGKVIEIYRMDVDISDRVEAERRVSEIKDKLESLALKDALTEIFNFRYFRERLASEFERAKRTLSPISILMMDIDYFKSINDTHGHQFGDKILKQVARFFKTELRSNDVVARWGGEEFAVILPDTNRVDGLAVANKMIDLFRTRTFGDGTKAIRLKCSMGLVSYPDDPLFSVEEIIDAGEESIYRVKERGGDGVAMYGHEMTEKTLDKHTEEDRRRYIDSVKQKLSFYAVRSERSILEAVYSLAKSIELRDRRTKEHCERMVEYAEKMARKVGMNELEVDNVRRSAMLHDIGKLGISDAILLKPGRLTPEEYEEVKKHPVIGADIISGAGFLKDIVPIILSHHEHWDGRGYPRGLKGEEIPLGARVIAVVDVYEALTSDRPYHKAISKEEAIKILKSGMSTQFDEKIVRVFLEVVN